MVKSGLGIGWMSRDIVMGMEDLEITKRCQMLGVIEIGSLIHSIVTCLMISL